MQPASAPCVQGQGDVEDRATNAGRPLRERRVVKPCPTCKADIADFLAHGQVNRCVMSCPSSFVLAWCTRLGGLWYALCPSRKQKCSWRALEGQSCVYVFFSCAAGCLRCSYCKQSACAMACAHARASSCRAVCSTTSLKLHLQCPWKHV